jgi:2-polyprenyl-6-methoxyphenol hydroxylase-like FAD-dependent oxidoreductase
VRAVIIGGGIGGLATALALRRVGIESIVVEQVPAIREVGAGLSLWSNAIFALRELSPDGSIARKVIAAGSEFDTFASQTASGRPIANSRFANLASEAGAPCVCIHRAELQRILLAELDPATIRTGTRCADFDGSTAILETGERIAADFLVGADGINSVIRRKLHGDQPPRYEGATCWRGLCQKSALLHAGTSLLALGPGTQFGACPCGDGQVYWFLAKNAPQGTVQSKDDALAACSGWAAPVLDFILATPQDAIVQNDILDRKPLKRWGSGRVTLLGDAAHASTPNLGQGACQAIEDAVTLADSLRGIQDVEQALRTYERLRIPRTTMIVNDSWRAGQLLQTEQPFIASFRDWFSASTIGQRIQAQMFRKLMLHRVPKL